MGSLFGMTSSQRDAFGLQLPAAPAPAPPAPIDYQAQADAKAAADAQRKAAVSASGRSSTILTGGLGDYSMAPTTQRTLLGGG